jgi:hypothetical protein
MNRADRRRLSSKPSPGSEPVTVTRQVPVTIIAGADGSRTVVETDSAEPCYACPCCVLWAVTFDKLRLALVEHEDGQHAAEGPPVDFVTRLPGCLVCQLLAGVVDK